jgi:Xaa-Pro aminopeptidase
MYSEEFANRRGRFLKALPDNSVAIIAASDERIRNGDSHYTYRQNSDFYYLTGFNEPEAVAVFIPGRAKGEFILFNRERDVAKETWDGPRAGQEGACSIYGADQAFPVSALNREIPKLLEKRYAIYYAIAHDKIFNRRVLSWLSTAQKKERSGIKVPEELRQIGKILHNMRLYKSPAEIDWMRQAADMSAQAHSQAMQACRPGLREYDLEAEIQYVFTKHGSRAPAYNHIIGAGTNSCVLHYNDNNAMIKDGDLVLIDAGAEYQNYAADITRTFPANGRFTPAQRAIYEAVLKTQLAVIEKVKPGTPWQQLQQVADRVLTEELVQLGLLKGNLKALLAKNACGRFCPHRIGHWLGMDVHDVGGYRDDEGQWRQLKPGMVLTVEPGIYIPAGSDGIDEAWWNIGVRIEDDVLVTHNGCEVLSAGAPKTVEAIEALMASTSSH